MRSSFAVLRMKVKDGTSLAVKNATVFRFAKHVAPDCVDPFTLRNEGSAMNGPPRMFYEKELTALASSSLTSKTV